jgi:hypothetical protein
MILAKDDFDPAPDGACVPFNLPDPLPGSGEYPWSLVEAPGPFALGDIATDNLIGWLMRRDRPGRLAAWGDRLWYRDCWVGCSEHQRARPVGTTDLLRSIDETIGGLGLPVRHRTVGAIRRSMFQATSIKNVLEGEAFDLAIGVEGIAPLSHDYARYWGIPKDAL